MRGPLPADLISFAALRARRNQYGGMSKEPILHVMKKKPVLKLMNTVQYGSVFRKPSSGKVIRYKIMIQQN